MMVMGITVRGWISVGGCKQFQHHHHHHKPHRQTRSGTIPDQTNMYKGGVGGCDGEYGCGDGCGDAGGGGGDGGVCCDGCTSIGDGISGGGGDRGDGIDGVRWLGWWVDGWWDASCGWMWYRAWLGGSVSWWLVGWSVDDVWLCGGLIRINHRYTSKIDTNQQFNELRINSKFIEL